MDRESVRVKVDLQCPFCGFCKTMKTGSHRKGITCPTCKQTIFLAWATGIEGYVDEHGILFPRLRAVQYPQNQSRVSRCL